MKVNGVAQRFDDRTKIESWVFSMRGEAVAAICDESGGRSSLCSQHTRLLGEEHACQRGDVRHVKNEPEYFFYYNNGITIVCDKRKLQLARQRTSWRSAIRKS